MTEAVCKELLEQAELNIQDCANVPFYRVAFTGGKIDKFAYAVLKYILC